LYTLNKRLGSDQLREKSKLIYELQFQLIELREQIIALKEEQHALAKNLSDAELHTANTPKEVQELK
jgi:hypothetical protein